MPNNESTLYFYTFNQSNPGGYFIFDESAGITGQVFIQATTKRLALTTAKKIGIYFDGVDKGLDCACCGDRWYPPNKRDRVKTPEKHEYSWLRADRLPKDKGSVVHYVTGEKRWF